MAFTIATTLIVIAANYFAIEYFFFKFNKLGTSIGLSADHVFFKFLGEQKHSMDLVFLVTGIVCFLILIIAGLYISHRVAGPLYRLHKHMNDVADGKTTNEVKFRNKDYFPELAEAYNKQLKRLK